MDKFLLRTKAAFFLPELDEDQIKVIEEGVDIDPEDFMHYKDALINIKDMSFINEGGDDILTVTTTSGEKYSIKKTKKIVDILESFMLK